MTLPIPYWNDAATTLYKGDALSILQAIPTASVDAVITDPPYSSGGMTTTSRKQPTSHKYVQSGTQLKRPEFYGDNRDQRSFLLWASLWLAECVRITRPGGYLLTFIDWRQLPVMSDALQVGGWIWRGVVPWDKTEGTRPTMGFFRNQCEYVLTASNGPMTDRSNVCLPGCFRENVRASEKRHITGKPVPLMKRLMEFLPGGSSVLDPFAGSGTTLVAARAMKIRSIGIEMSEEYCEIATSRLSYSESATLLVDSATTA